MTKTSLNKSVIWKTLCWEWFTFISSTKDCPRNKQKNSQMCWNA